MAERKYPERILKALWARSGGLCMLCKKPVVIIDDPRNPPTIIGEMAHIHGLKPNSPRYDPSMTDEERNSYENLLILCRNCHALIDKNPDKYPPEKLKAIKREHEKWVIEQWKISSSDVTFAELDVVIKYLLKANFPDTPATLQIIPPREKIRKNNLSSEIENLITMAMTGIEQVKEYLNLNPDPEFSGRLRAGFVAKYLELKNQGLQGDELFYELLNFASGNSNDFKIKAAGLKILTYFFETCEVFEK